MSEIGAPPVVHAQPVLDSPAKIPARLKYQTVRYVAPAGQRRSSDLDNRVKPTTGMA